MLDSFGVSWQGTAMRYDVKICGLTTPEAVDAAVGGGASHVGFIFFERSPRHLTPESAARLARRAEGRAVSVAVTVDADDEALDRIVSAMRPGMLQLHGRESPDRVRQVKARYALPVMKAIAVREQRDVESAGAYAGIADRLLFDAKAPPGSDLPGGNGVSFDWSFLRALDGGADYMLSGGLNKDNVAEALTRTGACAIDVSSGVETAPGVKDPARITAFLDTVRKIGGASSSGRLERSTS